MIEGMSGLPADLHVHSTASDGKLTPVEIVHEALTAGLTAIGLTDHDTVSGIPAALEAAGATHLEVIPGIEFSAEWELEEVHILGYYLEYQAPLLQDILSKLRRARDERAQAIIKKLAVLNIFISFDYLREIAGTSILGRPHIARAMIEAGYIASVREAFESYLGRGRPAYVPRSKLSPDKAIELVRIAKGVPVLAHPGLMAKDELIPELIKMGLLGIEVFYPSHTPEMVARYRRMCEQRNLIMTGGSDFHGPGLDYPALGTVTVSDRTVASLKMMHGI